MGQARKCESTVKTMDTQIEFFSAKISLTEAASDLEVSPATLRNWVKSGVVQSLNASKGFEFDKTYISEIKQKIINGEIARLRKRANKNKSEKRHAHDELLQSEVSRDRIQALFSRHGNNLVEFLNCLYVSALINKGILSLESLSIGALPRHIKNELESWNSKNGIGDYKDFLEECDRLKVVFHEDLLGFVYQSYCTVGTKQQGGAYYTPPSLVSRVIYDTVKSPGLFLDPCCGGGSFIVAAYKQLESIGAQNPHELVFGMDIDKSAVLVARANLTLASKGLANSFEQIKNADALLCNPFQSAFDFVSTNPPWGAAISNEHKQQLEANFRDVSSGESFSYFLLSALRMTKPGGEVSFILPEAFLNVKMHRDIRKTLIESKQVKSLQSAKERFSGVFTNSIVINIKNERSAYDYGIKINKDEIRSSEVKKDPDYCISIGAGSAEREVFRWIEEGERLYLKNQADWALGIVTGDNERFLSIHPKDQYEPILKGTDVLRFGTKDPSNFIFFSQSELQQVAPEEKYRTAEKIVYRFICKELVFAIDRSRALTLNSANILIPRINNYSLKVICGIFNSKLGQYYYQKKFNSIKTLRGNLEKFPFPASPEGHASLIEDLVTKLEKRYTKDWSDCLDEAVMDLYSIPQEIRAPIRDMELSGSFTNN